MGTLLVHITHGPEAPTRAALGLLAAGVGEADLSDKPAQMAMPNKLVQLTFESDRVLTY